MKKSIISIVVGSLVSCYANAALTDGIEVGVGQKMTMGTPVKVTGQAEYINYNNPMLNKYGSAVAEGELDTSVTELSIGYTSFFNNKMFSVYGSYNFGAEFSVPGYEDSFDSSYSVGADFGWSVFTPNTFAGISTEYSSSAYDKSANGYTYIGGGNFPTDGKVSAEINTLTAGAFVKHYVNNNFWLKAEAGLSFDAGSKYSEEANVYSNFDRASVRYDAKIDGAAPYVGISAGIKF